MIRKFILLFVFAPFTAFCQEAEYDSLAMVNMVIGFVETNAKVGEKITDKCELTRSASYKPIHLSLPETTIVTDYILCNNGSPIQYFEIYDGKNFKYIKNEDISFKEDIDKENLKVDFATMSVEDKNSIRKNVGHMADQIIDIAETSVRLNRLKELNESLAPFDRVKKYGIGLIKYNAVEGYSSTGATFKIFNPSSKTIKYIWFTVAGENAVEDLVRLSNGNYYTTLKGIGPVEPDGISSWVFDYVWFTDIVEYLRLSTIKIQYMDGSVKTVKYNEDMYIGEDQLDKVLNKTDEFVEEKRKNDIYIDPQKIYTEVDQLAEFPGGINKFRSSVTNNFDTGVIKGGEGVVKCTITFVVERDGTITDVKADGSANEFNAEAVRAVKSINNKWTPAKINGQAVRYRYRLPLTMNN